MRTSTGSPTRGSIRMLDLADALLPDNAEHFADCRDTDTPS
jgi:hypothetical protein